MESKPCWGMLFIKKKKLYHNKNDMPAAGIPPGAVWCSVSLVISALSPTASITGSFQKKKKKIIWEEVIKRL